MDRYHELSDATMDALLESLEVFLDGLGNPAYEVEYHVRPPFAPLSVVHVCHKICWIHRAAFLHSYWERRVHM